MPSQFEFDGFWKTMKHIPFLGHELPLIVISEHDDVEPTARQIAVVDSIDQIPESVLSLIDDQVRIYFKRIADLVDLEGEDIRIDEGHLAAHYSLDRIVIPRMQNCPIDYVFVTGECDWEAEHGMEILLKDGIPVECGSQDGLFLNAAWGKYIGQGA